MSEGAHNRRKGEEADAYAPFSEEAREAGFELRALQLAQRLFETNGLLVNECRTKQGHGPRETQAMRASVWGSAWERLNLRECGFRGGDAHLRYTDPFRRAVIDNLVRLVDQRIVLLNEAPPGMPRSVAEAEATNRMVDELAASINARVASVESKEPWRYRMERFMQALIAPLMSFKGFGGEEPVDPQITEIAAQAEHEGWDWGQVMHLAKAVGTFFAHGMEAVFAQIEYEEKTRDGTSGASEGQRRILDTSWVNALMHRMANRFIAGDSLEDAFENEFIKELLDNDIEITLAYEAEATFDTNIAQSNFDTLMRTLNHLGDRHEKGSGHPLTKFMSIKLSALGFFEQDPDQTGELPAPQIDKLKSYLQEMLGVAVQKGVFIRIDMEYFIHKDATFKIFKELLEENPEVADHLGLVFQAFLKDSPQDAEELVDWAKDFKARTDKRVSIRLVKGANMKRDKKHATMGLHKTLGTAESTWHGKPRRALQATGEDAQHPIAKDKVTTQRQFLQIMKLFEENGDCLDVAYGTMNRDTMAHILQTWLTNGENLRARRLKTLLGMYNSTCFALQGVVKKGRYVPYGPLGKILAYIGRRFVELKEAENGERMPVMRYEVEEAARAVGLKQAA